MNAVEKLIKNRIKEKSITRNTISQKLGYKNISKGLKRLDSFTNNLVCPNEKFICNLLYILEIPYDEFQQAVRLYLAEEENKARDRFKPFILIITESSFKPSPLLVAAMIQNQKVITVNKPLSTDITAEEQSNIFSLFKKRLSNISWDKKVDGFKYVRQFDQCLIFDNHGNLINIDKKLPNMPTITFQIGNKVVSGNTFLNIFSLKEGAK